MLGQFLFGKIGQRSAIPKKTPELIKKQVAKAKQNLDNQSIETRLSAIYELEQIAKDYPQYHWQIMETLAIFVRNNATFIPEINIESNPSVKICTDIQAALTVISRRDVNKDPENQQLDLSNTDMRGANFKSANLHRANLYQANLSRANLTDANLQQTILCAANLSQANLNCANLSGAILSAANLCAANLTQANLCGANLFLANLSGANLDGANLSGANLRDANLS